MMISNADVVYKKEFIYFRSINRQYIYIYIYLYTRVLMYEFAAVSYCYHCEEVWDGSLRIHVIALP